MNGQEIVMELGKKLAVMETKSQERWISHDLRSQELKETVDTIKKNLDDRPCLVHSEKFNNVHARLDWMWSVIAILACCMGGLALFVGNHVDKEKAYVEYRSNETVGRIVPSHSKNNDENFKGT